MIRWFRARVRTVLNAARHLAPVRRVATAQLPTEFGEFTIHVFENGMAGGTHVAMVRGEIGDGENVLARVHSSCLTGDIFHSARCDCGEQLHSALRRIAGLAASK
jgi:3,4-dihydroxy 2-butanone 4-phosphate synthase/GTP cyclohydrolase II